MYSPCHHACYDQNKRERTKIFFQKWSKPVERIPNKATLVFILAGQSNIGCWSLELVEPQYLLSPMQGYNLNWTRNMIHAKNPYIFLRTINERLDSGLKFGESLIRQIPDSILGLLVILLRLEQFHHPCKTIPSIRRLNYLKFQKKAEL